MINIIAAFVGGVVGSCLSFLFAFWLRNDDRRKMFQDEIGVIKARIIAIESKADMSVMLAAHRASLEPLAAAVFRVRPYIVWKCKRTSLVRLLDNYYSAPNRKGTGFQADSLAGNYLSKPGDMFADSPQAAKTLISILNDMEAL